MATYLSTTEEAARKKLAATKPMTSLTSKTIQAPKTTTTKTAATAPTTKTTTTAIVPKVNTAVTAPKPAATATTPVTKPPATSAVLSPIYGATDQMGSTGYASAKPAPAPTTTTTSDGARSGFTTGIGSVSARDKSGGTTTGGINVVGPGNREDTATDPVSLDTYVNDRYGDGQTDEERRKAEARAEALAKIKADRALRNLQNNDLDNLGNQVEEKFNDGKGNGGLDRNQADAFRRDPSANQDIDSMLEDFVRSGLSGDEYDDVEINADPYKDVSINHKTDKEMDKASRANIMKLLGYDEGDTGDEEAYIEKRVADQLGQQLVGSRASMGRAGFGSSGALYGMEGDQMRQANLDAEGRIYDVREREQNQAFDRNMAGAGLADDRDERLYDRAVDNANVDFRNQDERYGRATDAADNDYRNQTTEFGQKMDVAGLDQQGRQGARQDAILKAQLDAINAMMQGASGGEGEGGAGGPLDVNNDGIVSDAERGMDLNGDGEISAQERGRADTEDDRLMPGNNDAPDDANTYEDFTDSSPPWGYRTGQDGQYVYVVGLDGRRWRVPIGLYGQGG